jgi:hypothetical protein
MITGRGIEVLGENPVSGRPSTTAVMRINVLITTKSNK